MGEIHELQGALDFLRHLRENNDRAWFEAVDDLGGVTPKECMFRINRDIRFSNDKSPYKTAMGAVLGRAGRKSTVRSYYLHIEPDGRSMFAGGLYDPSPAELGKIRQAIAEDAKPLKRIVAARDFVRHFGRLAGESLKTAPQGYPKDHPEILLLRMKQFLATRALGDDVVASSELLPLALKTYKAMKPFLLYLEAALE